MKTMMINKPSLLACAVVLGLSACSPQQNTVNSSTIAAQTQKASLVSGIDTQYFDTSVKAQDNFYLHVNGKWLETTEIPGEYSNYGTFTKLAKDAQVSLRTIIERSAKLAKPNADEQKLGDFYSSYMDTETINALGLKPIEPYLSQIESVTDTAQLSAVMAKLGIVGVSVPLEWYVYVNAKESSQYITYMGQGRLGLPDRDYFLKDDEKYQQFRADYKTYIAKVFSLAGKKGGEEYANAIVELETKLAEAQWSRVERRDASKTYNLYHTSDLPKLFGGLSWEAYANATKLNDVTQIVIEQPSYVEALGNIAKATPLDTWKAYLQFLTMDGFANLLSEDFEKAKFAFRSQKLNGIQEQQPRWKRAVDASDQILGEILGKIYVAEHFKPEAKKRMKDLVSNLIKAYDISIRELDWMSEETKKRALEKLSKFKPKIGYPDEWKDYSELAIRKDDLVGNYVRYSEWYYAEMLSRLGKPIDTNEWHMTPQTVNAYYNPVMNEIVFPAAILQPPFFNLEADDAVNYGAIGAVIGHEIGHGFDDQGSKYDGDGNLKNWWTDADRKAFEERSAALVEQYNQFKPFDDANVNGQFTLGENIGDLGGLSIAFRAYQLSLQGKPSPELDGFTGEQRVFLGWSQIWRRKYREENLRKRLLTDPHSPSEYRVIGILPNVPEFYSAFDVKPEHKMYLPEEKRVKIW